MEAFWRQCLRPNLPALIPVLLTCDGDGDDALEAMIERLLDHEVPVYVCPNRVHRAYNGEGECTVERWTLRDYAMFMRRGSSQEVPEEDTPRNLYYLKDFHLHDLVRCMAGDAMPLYKIPPLVQVDYVDAFCAARRAGPTSGQLGGGPDYRFFYAGEAGTWTPLHKVVCFPLQMCVLMYACCLCLPMPLFRTFSVCPRHLARQLGSCSAS